MPDFLQVRLPVSITRSGVEVALSVLELRAEDHWLDFRYSASIRTEYVLVRCWPIGPGTPRLAEDFLTKPQILELFLDHRSV